MKPNINPSTDLVLERVVDVPRKLVWRAWTEPEHLKKWFTPAPWKTAECDIDLRPGGQFRFKMQGPEGEQFTHNCCYLEIVPEQKIVWTVALHPGYRPAVHASEVPPFTAAVLFEEQGAKTRYTAIAMHADEEGAKKHASMGFQDGWGAALKQLEDVMGKLRG